MSSYKEVDLWKCYLWETLFKSNKSKSLAGLPEESVNEDKNTFFENWEGGNSMADSAEIM